MEKMELEVKVLNINKESFVTKLESLGATLIQNVTQKLYTYDLPTIYSRYIDILIQLEDSDTSVKYETIMDKLRLLFFEIDNLLSSDDIIKLKHILDIDALSKLINKDNILTILKSNELVSFMKRFHNNSKKWIRLRQTNDKTTIAIKHILRDNDTHIQQMLETEMEVPSIHEANKMLEALGYCHKSYQEKERIAYSYLGVEIDIDTWPNIPTYFEIEGASSEEINDVLHTLGYSIQDTVSCTADDIYKMYNKSMFDKRNLVFKDE